MKAAILGATGMVGQNFVRLLADHPYFEPIVLTGSDASAGQKYSQAVDWVVTPSIPKSVSDKSVIESIPSMILDSEVDLVFSALPSAIADSIETHLAQAGLPVFSNAGAHRRDPQVPILIPEINPAHLQLIEHQSQPGFIVTNSNCSTSGLVFGLRPLMHLGIQRVIVTTYQAVSGAGRRGVGSLDILGNIIPYIANEEEKLVWEPRKILGVLDGDQVHHADLDIHASCARVPVLDGHLESVVIDLEEPISKAEVTDLFVTFSGGLDRLGFRLPTAPTRPIVVLSEPDRPQPFRDLSHGPNDNGMAVKIGRIRLEETRLSFYLLVHNTMRGAAGASILNAEFAMAHGYLTEVVP